MRALRILLYIEVHPLNRYERLGVLFNLGNNVFFAKDLSR